MCGRVMATRFLDPAAVGQTFQTVISITRLIPLPRGIVAKLLSDVCGMFRRDWSALRSRTGEPLSGTAGILPGLVA